MGLGAISFSKGFKQRINKAIEESLLENAPGLDVDSRRIEVIGVRDVGASFEPRLEIMYDVYFGKEYRGRYQQTLVLKKENRNVVCSLDTKGV